MLLTVDDIHRFIEHLPEPAEPSDSQDGLRAELADARSELAKAEDEAERLRAELDLLRPLADAASEYIVELERAHVSGSTIGADDALDALAEHVEAYVAAYPVE